MDAITLDRLLAELRPSLEGAFLDRPRLAGPHAVAFDLSRARDSRLRLDAGRGTAGLLLVPRGDAVEGGDAPPRARQAFLLLRKHLSGVRITGVERVAGERWVRLELGARALVLRFSGPAPALTLVVDGVSLATLGEGPEAWPLPAARPEVEWDRIDPEALVAAAAVAGRAAHRGVAIACPGLGPHLARLLASAPDSVTWLRERLRSPQPTVMARGPLEDLADGDLAPAEALVLAPLTLDLPGLQGLHFESFNEAALAFLRARTRGDRFEVQRRADLDAARRDARRLAQLEVHLDRDRAGLPDAAALRRHAEALLAAAAVSNPGPPRWRWPIPTSPAASCGCGSTRGGRRRPTPTGSSRRRAGSSARARQIDARLARDPARLLDAQGRESGRRRPAPRPTSLDGRPRPAPRRDPAAGRGRGAS